MFHYVLIVNSELQVSFMMSEAIRLRCVRIHNLENVDLGLPVRQ